MPATRFTNHARRWACLHGMVVFSAEARADIVVGQATPLTPEVLAVTPAPRGGLDIGEITRNVREKSHSVSRGAGSAAIVSNERLVQ